MKTTISIFQNKKVRKIWYHEEWYFCIIDVIEILTDSKNPSGYIKDMRRRDFDLSKGWGQIATPLIVDTTWGRQRLNCSNTEWLFRIIQSIPSPKAEPFKLWLAKVGYERIQEIEDPELALQRMRMIYQKKWYSQDWIQKRERGIAIRNTLTDEWQNRGIQEAKEYAILTDEIYQATFGMSAEEYKQYKWIDKHNLRDHMNDLEVIFTMLGEASTKEIMNVENSFGFDQIHNTSKKWWDVAKTARNDLESKTGKPIISNENYLADSDEVI